MIQYFIPIIFLISLAMESCQTAYPCTQDQLAGIYSNDNKHLYLDSSQYYLYFEGMCLGRTPTEGQWYVDSLGVHTADLNCIRVNDSLYYSSNGHGEAKLVVPGTTNWTTYQIVGQHCDKLSYIVRRPAKADKRLLYKKH